MNTSVIGEALFKHGMKALSQNVACLVLVGASLLISGWLARSYADMQARVTDIEHRVERVKAEQQRRTFAIRKIETELNIASHNHVED